MSGRALMLVSAALVSLALGFVISVATFYVARYGPSADGWSFRGNGAITVYFSIPAVMAAGWTALAAHVSGRQWPALGVGAGLVGLLLALLDASALPLFGPGGDRFWTPIVSVALLVWAVAAPRFALIPPSARRLPPIGWHLAAGIVWAAGILAGVVVGGVVFAAGS